MGSLRVGQNSATSLSLFTFMHWRRKWQPTLVLSPGESHAQRSLVGYSPRGHKESGTSEQISTVWKHGKEWCDQKEVSGGVFQNLLFLDKQVRADRCTV